jgi:hypothetical protein
MASGHRKSNRTWRLPRFHAVDTQMVVPYNILVSMPIRNLKQEQIDNLYSMVKLSRMDQRVDRAQGLSSVTRSFDDSVTSH